MHHPHGPEDIDVKHALYSGDVRVDSRHGVAWEQSRLEPSFGYILTWIGDSGCYICHCRQVSYLYASTGGIARPSKACTHAQLMRISRCPPVRAVTWDFKSSTDASTVTSSEKLVMPASDRWSLASLGSTVAMAWMPWRMYSLTSASPMPPRPHLRELQQGRMDTVWKDMAGYPVTRANRCFGDIAGVNEEVTKLLVFSRSIESLEASFHCRNCDRDLPHLQTEW